MFTKKPYLILVILIAFVSCNSSDDEVVIPDGLIPRDSLVSIIYDIHIADAYLVNNRLPKRNLNKNAFYKGILDDHGYERALFDSTIEFLSEHPEYYLEIYDDVLNSLSLFEAEIEKARVEKEAKEEEEKEKKKEIFRSVKVTGLKDTLKTESVHDSIFLERVTKAKKRFEERKNKNVKEK